MQSEYHKWIMKGFSVPDMMKLNDRKVKTLLRSGTTADVRALLF
jgi:hypothetical protein